MKAQLPHDIAAVSFDGLGAQVQQAGDFFGAVAFRQQLRDLTLARRQRRLNRGCKRNMLTNIVGEGFVHFK